MLIFPVKLYNVKENEKSMYLFIYRIDQFKNRTHLIKGKCCLPFHPTWVIDILLILPKICTIFGFKSSKLPSMKTTGSVSFLLNILHIVFRNIIHMLSILSTLDFLRKKAWF